MHHSTHCSFWLPSVLMVWKWVLCACLSSVPLAVSPAVLPQRECCFCIRGDQSRMTAFNSQSASTHSVSSLRWEKVGLISPYQRKDHKNWSMVMGAWLCSLLKYPIVHSEHFSTVAICISSFHSWEKATRKKLDIKYNLFLLKLDGPAIIFYSILAEEGVCHG